MFLGSTPLLNAQSPKKGVQECLLGGATRSFLLNRMTHFFHQLRCSAQSRALVRSFDSRLVSLNWHPFYGKKQNLIHIVSIIILFYF